MKKNPVEAKPDALPRPSWRSNAVHNETSSKTNIFSYL